MPAASEEVGELLENMILLDRRLRQRAFGRLRRTVAASLVSQPTCLAMALPLESSLQAVGL
jgi:hypothetical protein